MRYAIPILNPALIDSVQTLEWIARQLGSGLVLGKHVSRKLGSGMEFNQFRPYAQGDDLRTLDWKMYAKTGKYYVRMANIDVDNKLTIHIDNSLSMSYEEDKNSKLQIAKILTAALSYIMVQQSDQFAWESGDIQFASGGGKQHWKKSLIPLFNLKPTHQPTPFQLFQKGIHLWISDCYMELDSLKETLSGFMDNQREVVLFHLMGRKESTLSFRDNTKFIDLETKEELQVNVSTYSKEYQAKLENHFGEVKRYCTNQGIVFQQIYLDDPLADVLRSFITHYNHMKDS